MSSILVEVPTDPRTCRHQDHEQLGHDGQADFNRSSACGSIVIAQGSHRWLIRPTDSEGPLPF